jgi:hypothetical protein
MTIRTIVLASILALSGGAAFAESEGNRPAAVEIPASTGVYFSSGPAVQAMTPALGRSGVSR